MNYTPICLIISIRDVVIWSRNRKSSSPPHHYVVSTHLLANSGVKGGRQDFGRGAKKNAFHAVAAVSGSQPLPTCSTEKTLSSEGPVLLSCSPAVPSTDEEMELQDVAFPDETIPRFPSVWLKEGGLRMETARAGAKGPSPGNRGHMATILSPSKQGTKTT